MCYNSVSCLDFSALGSQTLDLSSSQVLDQTLDHNLLSGSQGTSSGNKDTGKRKFSELSQSQSDQEHYGDVDVIALKYKAAALVKLGDNSGSLVCLQK